MSHTKPVYFIKSGVVDQVVTLKNNTTAGLLIPQIDRSEFGDLTRVIVKTSVSARLPEQQPELVSVSAIIWHPNVGGKSAGFLADAINPGSTAVGTGDLCFNAADLYLSVSQFINEQVRLRIVGTGGQNQAIYNKNLAIRLYYEIYAW